jgi:flavoprotein
MHSKKKEIDVSEFWFRNERCRDYRKTGKGNIVPKEQYGKDKIWLLKCKTCGRCFSENYGTVFFQLKTPRKEVIRTLALFPKK